MKKLLVLSAISLTILQAVSAQQKLVADKIIGIVGDKIILQSDMEGALADQQRNAIDGVLPPNASCNTLEMLISQKVMVLQAERDSLPVSDGDIEGQMENRIRYFEQLYGSKEKMKEVTGYTVYQLRERFRTPIKENLLAQAMRNKVIEQVKATPSEVKRFFDAIPKDSLKFYESELEIGQVVITPKATREMDNYAIERLQEFKRRVLAKEADFSSLAILYSEDPGVKDNKGVYPMNRNDKNTWDPDFMAAAFRLKEGEISSPVKSAHGYHIIQMLKRQGDNITVQHILLRAAVTKSDLAKATEKLDSVRNQILAGKTTFAQAVSDYSDDPSAKFTGGMLQSKTGDGTLITIDQLEEPSEKEIVMMLDTLKPGGISKPTTFVDEQGHTAVRIVYLKTRTQPHRENLNDDYARIQQRCLMIKQAEAINKWLLEKIPTFYVHVDPEYKNCEHINQWMAQLAKQ
ncbi:periplasmic chaperone for outer membrane proteins SurA [Chitinophaga jiangningensis]|uniref:Periplasmic chaperone for outer membrane proteins SurA n=1 Tax=Chitinophaga jiangningensis TaxID=1419482 RepID=A0A1M7ED72_9BACT|nr:peptidylprolyl isomerase [Chitinophaga jiangningensis]SHL89558.1 periplasmic chaperone for outer membrane proteins SurA [Chitinophaga jiangningensis]